MASDVDRILPPCEPKEDELQSAADLEHRFGALEPRREQKVRLLGATLGDIELCLFYLFFTACCMMGYYHLVKGMENWFKQPPKPNVYPLGQTFMHMNMVTGLTGAARHLFGSQFVHYFVIVSYLTFLTMSLGYPMIACDFHRTMHNQKKAALFHLLGAIPPTVAWFRGQQLRAYNLCKWVTWVCLLSIALLCMNEGRWWAIFGAFLCFYTLEYIAPLQDKRTFLLQGFSWHLFFYGIGLLALCFSLQPEPIHPAHKYVNEQLTSVHNQISTTWNALLAVWNPIEEAECVPDPDADDDFFGVEKGKGGKGKGKPKPKPPPPQPMEESAGKGKGKGKKGEPQPPKEITRKPGYIKVNNKWVRVCKPWQKPRRPKMPEPTAGKGGKDAGKAGKTGKAGKGPDIPTAGKAGKGPMDARAGKGKAGNMQALNSVSMKPIFPTRVGKGPERITPRHPHSFTVQQTTEVDHDEELEYVDYY